MTTTRRLAAILFADVVCWVELRKFWNGQCRLLALSGSRVDPSELAV
jgi:hypothetical protein